MNMRIIEIFVCMLMIATVLTATGAMNFQTTKLVNENNYSELYPSTSVNSGIITIKIMAKVTDVSDRDNLLGGVIHVNDTITGKYFYDSGIPDSDSDPKIGVYGSTSSSCGIEVKAGGLDFKTNPSDVNFYIELWNDISNPPSDAYIVVSNKNLQLSNGMSVEYIGWHLDDLNATALSNDALPATAPVLADWESIFGLALSGKDPSNPLKTPYFIRADVNKATKSKTRDIAIDNPILRIFDIHPLSLKILQFLFKQLEI
jgi:hypothetical protein